MSISTLIKTNKVDLNNVVGGFNIYNFTDNYSFHWTAPGGFVYLYNTRINQFHVFAGEDAEIIKTFFGLK